MVGLIFFFFFQVTGTGGVTAAVEALALLTANGPEKPSPSSQAVAEKATSKYRKKHKVRAPDDAVQVRDRSPS